MTESCLVSAPMLKASCPHPKILSSIEEGGPSFISAPSTGYSRSGVTCTEAQLRMSSLWKMADTADTYMVNAGYRRYHIWSMPVTIYGLCYHIWSMLPMATSDGL